MNPERLLADFLNENPCHRGGSVSAFNEFGTPLSPSGMYAFWAWQAKTCRMNRDAAKSLCEAFERRFGEGVMDGDVLSWGSGTPAVRTKPPTVDESHSSGPSFEQAAIISLKLAERCAAVLAGIAQSTRMRIIDLLRTGPKTVTEIATSIRLTVANTSLHLKVMRVAGLVETEQDGRFVIYSLAGTFTSDKGGLGIDLGWCRMTIA